MGAEANVNAGGLSGEGQAGEGQQAAPAFDQVKFNQNLHETLASRDRELTQTILTAVAGMKTGQERANDDVAKPPAHDELLQEVATEAEALGMNEDATKNFISLATKIFNKKTPSIKDETKNEIRSELSHEDQKRAHNAEVTTAYPQVLDDTSALRREARSEYSKLDPHILKSPQATRIATERAARKLGIEPLTIADIRAREAITESGNGGGGKKVETGATQEQVDFAMGFGVKPDAFKKKFAIIQKRSFG